MKRNKQLEKEIKKLRRKKNKEDWFFLYGIWIIVGLFILGLIFRVILSVKNGISSALYFEIPKVGSVCVR